MHLLSAGAEFLSHGCDGGCIQSFCRAREDGLFFALNMFVVEAAELARGDQQPFLIFLAQLA